jgi:hypothetical protein
MNVNGMGNMQHTQMQTQMRKMDGSGEGKGNGMGGMMKNIPEEDKAAIKDYMESLSTDDKKVLKEEMSKIDTSNMSVDEITTSLMSVVDSFGVSTTNDSMFDTPVYA